MTLWTIALQVPLSVGFSRQEYWNTLPFPPPRDLPNPRIEPVSPTLHADYLLSHQGSPLNFSSVGFLRQIFWGFISPLQIPRVSTLHSSRGSTRLVRSLHIYQGFTVRLSFLCLDVALYPFLVKKQFIYFFYFFGSFSEVNNSHVAVDLVCPWEEMPSGSPYAAISDPST